MNLQALVDAMGESSRLTRAQYQLTLGGLIDKLRTLPFGLSVRYMDGAGPGREQSYRGYYSDLAFTDGDPVNVDALLKQCEAANGGTYEGYKGGDFTMSDDTPLWRSEYGSASGVALMDIQESDGAAVIVTKQID